MSRVIESVTFEKMRMDLLATGDGTEVIHHSLPANRQWNLVPQPGWNALEFVYVLSGEMVASCSDRTETLKPGDHIGFCPVREVVRFETRTDTTFLYATSRPVFQAYSRTMQEMGDLAIAIEGKDGYTHDHCRRIAHMSRVVGEWMGLTPEQHYHLNIGAFLHDIGKVRLPPSVLGKKGPLTPDEWTIIKQHPTLGAAMMRETGNAQFLEAAEIVEQHHERWDGTGYPHGLGGERLLLTSTIVTLVDSYDAMVTDRPYRRGITRQEAIEEILRCRGTQFRPDVVEAFLTVLPDLPY